MTWQGKLQSVGGVVEHAFSFRGGGVGWRGRLRKGSLSVKLQLMTYRDTLNA